MHVRSSGTKYEFLFARVPQDFKATVLELCKREDTSQSEFIRQATSREIERRAESTKS